MGKVELGAKKKKRNKDMKNAVLATVAVAGVIAVAAIAPNAIQLLKTTGMTERLRHRSMSALGRLKAKGEVEFLEMDGKKYARLTARGEKTLAYAQEKLRLQDKKPRRWDRRYRLIIFDIPEKRRKTREHLRLVMRDIGFLRIQDSAWVFPYDCEEFVALLKADLHIGKDVLYAVIEEIENDAVIRRHFGLPKK